MKSQEILPIADRCVQEETISIEKYGESFYTMFLKYHEALEAAEQELSEMEQSFELQHKAFLRGNKMYLEATNQKGILMDSAKLIAWLLEDRDATLNKINEYEKLTTDLICENQGLKLKIDRMNGTINT